MNALFTLVFLVFMAGSGERIATVHSKEAYTEHECLEKIDEFGPLVAEQFQEQKGFKVQLMGMCIPEERKA